MIILLYHNVIEHRPSAFNMLTRRDWLTVDQFDEEIASVAERYELVSVGDIASAVRDGRTIPRAVAVTFDDGYACAKVYGQPVLDKYGVTATYFVITSLVHDSVPKTYDFFDRLEGMLYLSSIKVLDLTELGLERLPLTCDECKLNALKYVSHAFKTIPADLQERLDVTLGQQLAVGDGQIGAYLGHEAFQPMSWADVADLQQCGHGVGSHSRTHRALSQLDAKDLRCELAGSLDDLRSHGVTDAVLAYPFGQEAHYNAAVIDSARAAGYRYALTAIPGINDAVTPVFELYRATFRDLKKLRKAV